jgi:hypothetical protein
MNRKKSLRSLVALFCAGGILWLGAAPLRLAAQAGKNTGALTGNVFVEDLKTPVEGAVIKIRNLVTGKEYQSPPTDKNGTYLIQGIEEGHYSLGVSSKAGDFNFEFQIYVKAGETGKLSVALKPGAPVVVAAKKAKKSFFLTPLGIATALGALAATTAVVSGIAGSSPAPAAVSPSRR